MVPGPSGRLSALNSVARQQGSELQPGKPGRSIQIVRPASSARISASTMISTSSGVCTCGFQPSIDSAFDASPTDRINLGGPQIAFVESNVAFPVEARPDRRRGRGIRAPSTRPGSEHKVVGCIDLQHPPHALDVLRGVSPVAHRVDVAHPQVLIQPGLDARYRAGDLARDECFTAPR